MAWGKAGSTTLASTGDTLTTTGMTASIFNQFLFHTLASGNADTRYKYNSTDQMALRYSQNGGSDATSTSDTPPQQIWVGYGDHFNVNYMLNISGKEKLVITSDLTATATGAGTAPARMESVHKSVQSDQITEINISNGGSGDYLTDSNLTALGSDLTPAVAIPAIDNVQDNSLFVDKVNAKRYWFSADNSGFPTNSSNYPDGNNGTNGSRIDIPTTGLTSLTNGSVAFWVHPLEAATDAADFVILSGSDSSAASTEMIFGFIGNTSKVGIHARSGGSWTLRLNAGSLPKSQWSHVVYTNSTSSGNKVYVNGAEVTPSYTNGSASSNVFFNNVTTNTFTIGANKDSGGYQWGMEGNVQQVLIYNTTLSASDVTTLYNSGNYNSSPSSTGLLRRYELTSDVNDSSGNSENGTASSISFTSIDSPTPATWNDDMTGITGALTVDNFTVGSSTQASSTGTESHTVSASSKQKKILLVTVRTAGVDSTQSSCTYAGVAMTSLGTDICGSGNHTRQTCFYLLNPPTGTADIVVTKSNSSAHCKIIALSLYGAKQSAPTFAINAGQFSPTAGITTNITPPANSWVYSSLSGSSPTNSATDPPSTYYTNAELTVLNSDTSVTKKKYGLKKDPTTGSTNAVKMYFKHSANNNSQPVVLSVFAVESLT